MSKRVIDLRDQRPLLDIVTHARGGGRLTAQQREQILLTIRRVPEVMVKVSGGAHSLAGVRRHMKYIGRGGDLGMETDMATQVGGAKFERDLVEDWDLDLETLSCQSERGIRSRRPGKLVHNIIFSMPPGTPPAKVLQAVRNLALNEWQLRHRYAMALHSDTSHPHVHVVLKAVSEQGERLNIRKATLRSWRAQFAANLRNLGVSANATERAVRGQCKTHDSDGFYRAALRGDPRRIIGIGGRVVHDQRVGVMKSNPGAETSRRTRAQVVKGWRLMAAMLRSRGDHSLADRIQIFTRAMKPPMAEDGMPQKTERTAFSNRIRSRDSPDSNLTR